MYSIFHAMTLCVLQFQVSHEHLLLTCLDKPETTDTMLLLAPEHLIEYLDQDWVVCTLVSAVLSLCTFLLDAIRRANFRFCTDAFSQAVPP